MHAPHSPRPHTSFVPVSCNRSRRVTRSVSWPGTESYYAFANDGSGDQYLIDPHAGDPQVLYYEHETKQTRPVGASLSQFIAARRVYGDE